ncbi:MAG: ATP-dependent DNA helicase RecG [Gordonia sp. (in: high G+C Gram-positive bacteria)]
MGAGLAALGLHTVGELLRFAPRRYVHRGAVSAAQRFVDGEWVSIVGVVEKSTMVRMRRRSGQFLKVAVADEKTVYEISFFNPWTASKELPVGTRAIMAGKLSLFNGRPQLAQPRYLVLSGPDTAPGTTLASELMAEMYELADARSPRPVPPARRLAHLERAILPLYPSSAKCQTWDVFSAVCRVLELLEEIPDALAADERRRRGLLGTDAAIRAIHLPESERDLEPARERLKFDEALAIQLVLAQRRLIGRGLSAPRCPHVPGGLEDRLRDRLPFTLTEGQRLVGAEIGADLGAAEPMNRLLQGEVGSGKTLVALLAMLRAVDNGHQCVLLAPTEVLAAQHHRTIATMLGELGAGNTLGAADGATAIGLLTGSMRTTQKRQTLLDVVSGAAGIVIGTHAILEEKVTFFDLGLVVVDEQHRFGVEQRDVLRGRGRAGNVPHVLVMTATPIPRTVAMTAFGDLDTSVLDELPQGRRPISTSVVPMDKQRWVDRTWERTAEEIAAGRQVYVVCSRIGDDETPAAAKKGAPKKAAPTKATKSTAGSSRNQRPHDGEDLGAPADEDEAAAPTTSVLEQYEALRAGPLGAHRIALLHGRMPPEEKAAVMDAFGAGEVDILVSTTVIEVGVDVPNATMMVVVDAERFGVSQLHQLRGRVGRGGLPGLCLLLTRAAPDGLAMERLRAVAASNDGFELARIDLLQRREGDVLGSLQHGGESSLRFLSLLDDDDVLADAREFARTVVAADLTLAGHPALVRLADSVLGPQKLRYLDKA